MTHYLEAALGDSAISVYGSLAVDEKVARLTAWLAAERPVLLSKASVCGFGLNMQRTARMAFVGLNDSWQQEYQALRRCWRYGQTRPVHAYLVLSTAEQDVYNNVMRKETEAAALQRDLIAAVATFEREELYAFRAQDSYAPQHAIALPDWLQSVTTAEERTA